MNNIVVCLPAVSAVCFTTEDDPFAKSAINMTITWSKGGRLQISTVGEPSITRRGSAAVF